MTQPISPLPSTDPVAPKLSLSGLARAAGVPEGSLRQARELRLLPPPDFPDGRWSTEAANIIKRGWPRLSAALQAAQELGAERCAELLSRTTGLAVRSDHVRDLDSRGFLSASRTYRRHPVYRVADVEALASDPVSRATLSELIG